MNSKSWSYDSNYKDGLEESLTKALKLQIADTLTENIKLTKRITELKNDLEKLDERFAFGKIDVEPYEKFSLKN